MQYNTAIQERFALIGIQYCSKKVMGPISLMIEYDIDKRPTPLELKALLDNENKLPTSQSPAPHLNVVMSAHSEMLNSSKHKMNIFQQVFDEEQARYSAY
jgi:hypothetical protein